MTKASETIPVRDAHRFDQAKLASFLSKAGFPFRAPLVGPSEPSR